MRKTILIATLAAGAALAGLSPALARDGCGPDFHRGPYGHCRPNHGPGPGVIVPGGPEYGVFYPGRGYWDGHRYWQHREHWRRGWRFH